MTLNLNDLTFNTVDQPKQIDKNLTWKDNEVQKILLFYIIAHIDILFD